MINFPSRNNHQPDDASREDELDQFLNTLVASDGPPDVNQNPHTDRRDSEPLFSSADAFHRRMEVAQKRNLETSQPAPDLWDRILKSHAHYEKESEMSSAPIALESRPQQQQLSLPRSLPPGEPKEIGVGHWANAIAAVFLVIAIGAGVWFSGYGPGGGGQGDDSTRFAALGVTPGISPEVAEADCDVAPLTEEEVMENVLNPNNGAVRLGDPQEHESDELFEAMKAQWRTSIQHFHNVLPLQLSTSLFGKRPIRSGNV